MYRTGAFIVLLTASIVGVQSYGYPECAGPCDWIGNCDPYNYACVCDNKTLVGNLGCCLVAECDATNQTVAAEYLQWVCSNVGITGLPSTATCAPGFSFTNTDDASTTTSTSTSTVSASSSSSSTHAQSTTSLSAPKSNTAQSTTTTSGSSSSSRTTSIGAGSTGAAATHAAEALGLGVAVVGLMAML